MDNKYDIFFAHAKCIWIINIYSYFECIVCMYFSVFSQQTCLLINNKYAGCRKSAQMPYGNSAGPKQSLDLGPVVQSIISLTSSLVVKV